MKFYKTINGNSYELFVKLLLSDEAEVTYYIELFSLTENKKKREYNLSQRDAISLIHQFEYSPHSILNLS